jgi:hypothetical protein
VVQFIVDIYCLDLINIDRSNITDILSDTNLILTDMYAYYKEDYDIKVQVIGEPSLTPLNNQLLDYAAGWVMRITLEVPNYTVCVVPFKQGIPYIEDSNVDVIQKRLTCETLSTCETIQLIEENISNLNGQTVSSFDYTPSGNTLTITLNNGFTFDVGINSMSGMTFNGPVYATTYYGDGSNLSGISTTDIYTTGGTYDNNTQLITFDRNDNLTYTVDLSALNLNDTFVTGGTYNNSTGTAVFTNNSGGTFNVSGFFTGSTDTFVTGFTFNPANYQLDLAQSNNSNFNVDLSILASDVTITGGTYDSNNGTATFTDNTGSSFNVTGFLTGFTDIYTTGATYDNNTQLITFNRNDNGTYTVDLSSLDVNDTFSTGGTVTQFASNNNNEQVVNITGNSGFTPYNITGITDTFITGVTFDPVTYQLDIQNNNSTNFNVDLSILADDIFVTGGTYNNSNGTATFTNNNGGTFDVSGFVTGFTDVFTTGATYDVSTGIATFTRNDGNTYTASGFYTGYTLTSTEITNTLGYTPVSADTNTFVTGFTFNPGNYQLDLEQNNNSNFNVDLSILASDVTITGGTYDNSTGTATFTNNSGGTFNVSGFLTGFTDIYTTGATYDVNTGVATFTRNDGNTYTASGFYTGYTLTSTEITNALGYTPISADTNTFVTGFTFDPVTYQLDLEQNNNSNFNVDLSVLADDVFVTGGTYNNSTGTATFTNNSGGTFDVSGFVTGFTDVFTTGATYDVSTGIATFTRNDGNTYTASGFYTGYTLTSTEITTALGYTPISADTNTFVTGFTFDPVTYQLDLEQNNNSNFNVDLSILATDMVVTGGTYNPSNGTATFTNNSGGTFDVTGFLTGMTDVFTTGATYDVSTGIATFTRNDGNNYTASGFYTGYTLTSSEITTALGYTPLSAYTDTFVTGGTYDNSTGTATFTNNSGGTFNVSGFLTGSTGTQNLTNVLAVGNSTGANNIVVENSQKIESVSGNTSIEFVSDTNLNISSTNGIDTSEIIVRPNDIKILNVDTSTALNSEIYLSNGEILFICDDGVDVNTITFTPTGISGIPLFNKGSFGITIDGGGSVITTGVKGYVTVPYNGTITGWDIFADVTGSIVIDVWKDTYANFPPLVADTIAGTEKPTLSSAIKNQDTNLTSWTTAVTAGDIIAFNVDSASTLTRVNLIIYVTKS